jgi:hypothetical protein
MDFAYLVSLLPLGCIAFAVVREMSKPSDDDNRRVLAVLAYLGS